MNPRSRPSASVDYASVPKLWPGATIVILATGPSLTPADVDSCRGKAKVLAIKDAIRLAPWADALYACDAKWWRHHLPTFDGPRYTLELQAARWASVLNNTGFTGLESDPSGLKTGKNSGYQAINLAVHLGARRILLLGYDMQPDARRRDHWFGKHPYPSSTPPYAAFVPLFETLLAPLQAAGVEVLNCSRHTALTWFRRVPLDEALREAVAA